MRVRFHLPDFSGSFKLNLLFAEMLKNRPDFFRDGVEIASVYGVFPPCLWNGGRSQGGNTDKNYMKAVIKEFNSRGIPLRFTFTNIMLEKKHLSDERCNMMLHLANNGMNEVIVASPLLEEYIRKEYPGYKLTSSTCKRLNSREALTAELEKDYHVVVADYDLNNKFDILEDLPRKKDVELLVNACCQPECAGRLQHYKDISLQQIAFCSHIKKYPNVPFDLEKYDPNHFSSCPYSKRNIFDIRGLKTHISPEVIWEKYVPMGFKQFKIEGRTASTLNKIETYLYYMAKPELREEARYFLLNLMEDSGALLFT